MATKKKQEASPEVQPQTEEKIPLGLAGNPHAKPLVEMPQFFDLLKIADTLSKVVSAIKQANVDNGNVKYYFQEDLVEVKDDQGATILIPDGKGGNVPQMTLNPTFWN